MTRQTETTCLQRARDLIRPRQSDGGFAAVYAPWIELPARPGAGVPLPCPPSGHICGIYARTDATRGVHKAPANTPIYGALGPTSSFTRDEIVQLAAAHVNPLSANRSCSGSGIATSSRMSSTWSSP